jgi:hypothetical protein
MGRFKCDRADLTETGHWVTRRLPSNRRGRRARSLASSTHKIAAA